MTGIWLNILFLIATVGVTLNYGDAYADDGTTKPGIYSLSEKFAAGTIIPWQSLVELLKAHGYQQVNEPPTAAGQYQLTNENAAIIIRDFVDSEGNYSPKINLVYDFRNGRLQNKLGPELNVLQFEPQLLAAFDGSETKSAYGAFIAALKEQTLKDKTLSAKQFREARIFTSISTVFQQCGESAIKIGTAPKALIALDVKTQGIRAWVESAHDHDLGSYVTSKQPRGALLRPFIYISALDTKLKGSAPLSPLETIGLATAPSSSKTFREIAEGFDSTESTAIAAKVGGENLQHTLDVFHIKDSSLLNLTSAFGAFANGGNLVSPQLYTATVSDDGKTAVAPKAQSAAVTNPVSAFMLTDMLRGVVNHGVLYKIRNGGYQRDIAAASGTTGKNKAAWMIGYTPILAVGVWTGEENSDQEAIDTWLSFMKCADATIPEVPLAPPQGVQMVPIDRSTFMLATRRCPQSNVEAQAFAADNVPTETCSAHPGTARRPTNGGYDPNQNPAPQRRGPSLPRNPVPDIWRGIQRGANNFWKR